MSADLRCDWSEGVVEDEWASMHETSIYSLALFKEVSVKESCNLPA